MSEHASLSGAPWVSSNRSVRTWSSPIRGSEARLGGALESLEGKID